MRFLLFILMTTCLLSCKNLPQKATKAYSDTTGMGFSHDASVENPPEGHQEKKEEKAVAPPGSKVTKTETAATADKPATTTTVIELPKDKGMDLSVVNTKTDLVGSKGFQPPKGPSPTDKANAGWTYAGIAMAGLGVFFCTPWGGSNYRIGAVIAAGGIGMSIIGKFISQLTMPSPVVFSVSIVIALAMYYAYQVRKKQEAAPTTK